MHKNSKLQLPNLECTLACYHGRPWLGIDIMCACDVRYAAEDSTFSIKATPPLSFPVQNKNLSTQESDVGLAADVGSLAYLPKLTGNQSLL